MEINDLRKFGRLVFVTVLLPQENAKNTKTRGYWMSICRRPIAATVEAAYHLFSSGNFGLLLSTFSLLPLCKLSKIRATERHTTTLRWECNHTYSILFCRTPLLFSRYVPISGRAALPRSRDTDYPWKWNKFDVFDGTFPCQAGEGR